MIGATEHAVVLRTDFSEPKAWDAVKKAIAAPVGAEAFLANVVFVDDQMYESVTEENLRSVLGAYHEPFIILADAQTMKHAEHPLLVIDLSEEQEPSFRALPQTVQAIENNLTIANMGFEEFADEADEQDDGIFRGFE